MQVGSAIDVWLQVLVLVALPGPETEVLGIEHKASELAEVEQGPCLDAESATPVVVALNDVEVVTLGTTQQNATYENSLFHLRQSTHLGQREDEARAEAGSLADAVRCKTGTVLNGLRIVVVEVLVDTELASHVFLVQNRCAPQTSYDVQCVH